MIARYAGDGSHGYRLLQAAEALVEIDAIQDAIDYAHRAAFHEGGIHAVKAGALWAGLLRQHHPEQELAARQAVFARFPTSTTAGPLRRVAVEQEVWADLESGVLEALAGQVREVVVFLLFDLHHPVRAFHAAIDGELPHARWNDELWNDLIDQQLLSDPAVVIPIIEQQVDQLLEIADAHNYRLAARRLRVLRRAAAAAGDPGHADTVIQQLRLRHKNRPRLQLEFDRAHLPPLARTP